MLRHFALCGVVGVVYGCASTPTAISGRSTEGLQDWVLQGRFAAHDKTDAWNGELLWQQTSDEYQLELSGPLAQGKARLRGHDGYAELSVSAAEVYTAHDAQSLLYQHTGIFIPVTGLRHWVLGRPSPDTSWQVKDTDAQGRVVRFEQDGWTVALKRYTEVEGYLLPDKLYLSNSDFTLRLAIDEWRVSAR